MQPTMKPSSARGREEGCPAGREEDRRRKPGQAWHGGSKGQPHRDKKTGGKEKREAEEPHKDEEPLGHGESNTRATNQKVQPTAMFMFLE